MKAISNMLFNRNIFDLSKSKTLLIVIMMCAFILRFSFGLYYGSQDKFITESDHWAYDQLAINLVNGNGYMIKDHHPLHTFLKFSDEKIEAFHNSYYYGVVPYGKLTSFWEPGYPLFLAAVYKIFGHHYIIPLIIQAFLWVGIIWMALRIMVIMGYPREGLISAGIIAFFPVFIFISGSLMSETLFIFVTFLLIFLLFRNRVSFSWMNILLSGALFGYSFLIRSNLVFWIIILMIFIYFSSSRFKMLSVVTWLLMAALVVSPWVIYNYNAHGKIFVLPTKGVRNFWGWNNPQTDMKMNGLKEKLSESEVKFDFDSLKIAKQEYKTPRLSGTTEIERTDELKKMIIENLKSDPVYFVKKYFERFFQLMSPLIRSYSPLAKITYAIFYFPILILSLIGYYYGVKNDKWFWLFFALIFSFMLVTPLIYWRGRFKLIVEPFIIMFASYYLVLLIDKMKIRYKRVK